MQWQGPSLIRFRSATKWFERVDCHFLIYDYRIGAGSGYLLLAILSTLSLLELMAGIREQTE